MIKTKKQMYTVIGAFLLVMLLTTVTYAFFNYTRTGVANNIRTGRIYFNAEQGDTVTLSDLFPITASGEVTDQTPGVGSLSIHVTGDTTYEEGIEYLVKAVDVSNSSGGASLPISIAISYEAASGEGNTIGQADNSYFTNRGGNSSIYKVLSSDSITDDGDLVVGYIAPGATGVDGYITIMAYLDASNIAITDTYPAGNVTHYESSGETSIEVVDYTDGTSSEWVGDRIVFTTQEWNALQATGVSFKIKVEANEGTWVPEPIPTISSCPGCKFIYTSSNINFGGANNPNATAVSSLTGVTNDYRTLNKNFFLGFTETQDEKIDRIYACGIKGENPNLGVAFCIEGGLGDSSGGDLATRTASYNSNVALLNDSSTGLWQGTCTNEGSGIYCGGTVYAKTEPSGHMYVGSGSSYCISNPFGYVYCS